MKGVLFILLIALVAFGSAYKCNVNVLTSEWTEEDMLNAIPLDMVLNATNNTGVTVPACAPYQLCQTQKDTSFYTGDKALGKSVGKVFFKLGGSSYVCSASIGAGNLVWTAGHCLYERVGNIVTQPRWATDWVFVNAYYNTNEPYGRRTATKLCTTDQFYQYGWANNGIPFDYALAVFPVQTFAAFDYFDLAKPVSNPANQMYESYGYGQAAPFNGLWDNYCHSYACKEARDLPAPYPIGMTSDNTGGSSGGPWLIDVGSTSKKYEITGVNSFKYNNDPDQMYSSRFDDRTATFFKDIASANL